MGIYIKSMMMPKTCYDCPLQNDECFGSVKCSYVKTWGSANMRAVGCPLIEVSIPHRRLIDADEAYKAIKKWIVKFYGAYEQDKKDERIAALLELDLAIRAALQDVPAIIEAEVDENNA